MSIVHISQIVGTAAIFILFCINFYIGIHEESFQRTGKVAILWTTIYFFFLFALRLFSLLGVGTMDELRVISGFASMIPLLAIVSHLFIFKKLQNA